MRVEKPEPPESPWEPPFPVTVDVVFVGVDGEEVGRQALGCTLYTAGDVLTIEEQSITMKWEKV